MTRMRFWFVAFVVLVFAMGGFTGVVVDRLWLVRPRPTLVEGGPIGLGLGRRGSGAPPAGLTRQMNTLTRWLSLSADQQARLREILTRWNDRAATLQEQARQQFASEQDALLAEIEAVLTPDQVEVFRDSRAGRLLGRGGPAPGRGRGRGLPSGPGGARLPGRE
jgi:hypothetical protein